VYLLDDIRAGVGFYLLVCGANLLHCAEKSLPWWTIFAVLLGLLAWWPMVWTRIKYGYAARDRDDDPQRHLSKTGHPADGPLTPDPI
jgi:hypothetical protein